MPPDLTQVANQAINLLAAPLGSQRNREDTQRAAAKRDCGPSLSYRFKPLEIDRIEGQLTARSRRTLLLGNFVSGRDIKQN